MALRIPALAVMAALLLAVSPVSAGSFTADPLTLATGASPFAACTVGGPGTVYTNAEVEPWVEVNPTNPANLIAVYQQDRWQDGGARGLVASVSFNGGATWTRTWAPFSTCSGGTAANGGDYDRATDPWVSFGPTGIAYQMSLSINADSPTSAMLVSRSTDGGLTWSNPATLIKETHDFHFNDKNSITADPTNANFVYAVWDRIRKPGDLHNNFQAFHSFAFRGDPTFTRSTDAGLTWEAPRDILARNRNEFSIGNQIAVLPDGILLDVFDLLKGSGIQGSVNPFTQAVLRSTDKGMTWSRPITISTEQSVAVRDPETGAQVRAGTFIPDVAVNSANGNVYVVWADSRFSGGARDDIALSRSTDGGLTWSAPVKVNLTPVPVAAFTPSVDVAADGTVGVTYYDFRNNTSDPTTLWTDYFLAHSHDHGLTWTSEARITPTSFDMATAPDAGGFFTGDYEGLDHVGNAFAPFVILANSGNIANRTDGFFTYVRP